MSIRLPALLPTLALALCAAVSPLQAEALEKLDGIPAFDGFVSTDRVVETRVGPTRPRIHEVPDFDPVRDVPEMENWVPETSVDGPAHCFGMSLLTTYFHRRVVFDSSSEGESLATDWRWDDLGKKVVEPDPAGLQLIYEYLGTRDELAPLTVGGHDGLHAFTGPGGAGVAHFRRSAEAIQFLLQIPTLGPNYLKGILFASVDLMESDEFDRPGLVRKAFSEIQERIGRGELAPITLHPAKAETDGHVIVAYKVEELGNEGKIYCYDSNYPPRNGSARPTVLTVDLDAGSYQSRNHRNSHVYRNYELITVIHPESLRMRTLFRNITRHLDRYLWATDKFYTIMEKAMKEDPQTEERWKDWKKSFLPDWEAGKEAFGDQTHWKLRWKLRDVR